MYGSRAIFISGGLGGRGDSGARDGERGWAGDDLAAVLAELVFELFERAAAGLGHAALDEHDRADVDDDEEGERGGRAGRLDEMGEDLRDGRVDRPEHEDGDAHREAADRHW